MIQSRPSSTGEPDGCEADGVRVWVRDCHLEVTRSSPPGTVDEVEVLRLATVRIFDTEQEARAWAAEMIVPVEIHPARHVPAKATVASAQAIRQATSE